MSNDFKIKVSFSHGANRVANGSNGGPVVATATATNAVQRVEPATNSTDDANDDDETNAKTAARELNSMRL